MIILAYVRFGTGAQTDSSPFTYLSRTCYLRVCMPMLLLLAYFTAQTLMSTRIAAIYFMYLFILSNAQ